MEGCGGRLYQSSDGVTVRRFLYAPGESGIYEAISEYDGSNGVRHHHAFGPSIDEPLMRWDAGAWPPRLLHADERGSIVGESDSSGNAVAINRYDEFGKPAATNQGRFQYTGQLWMPELSLYHYKARAYAPHLGRFMQTDPIGYAGGVNLYAYVGNDPVNLIDPLGLCDAVTGNNCEFPVVGPRQGSGGFVGGGGSSYGYVGDSPFQELEHITGQEGGEYGAAIDSIAPGEVGEVREARRAIGRGVTRWIVKKFLSPKAVPKPSPNITPKISKQLGSRGWTPDSIKQAIDKGPVGRSTNRATDNSATVYGGRDGYVVVDDVTGDIFQISRRGDPTWVPDGDILWF